METLTHSEELKIHTQDVHTQLEQKLIPLIRSVSTRSQYADLLKLFYTYYAPLERRLGEVPGMEALTAGIRLRKSDSLMKDLEELGDSAAGWSPCSDLPSCADLSQAFGIMYVMEGSVLGGKAIAGIVTKKLPAETLPFSFFLHYRNDAENMWDQFKATLDSNRDVSRSALLSAATDTFVKFKIWIDKNTQHASQVRMQRELDTGN